MKILITLECPERQKEYTSHWKKKKELVSDHI